MLLGFVLLFGYALVVWLVFFKFKWLKFSIVWGIFRSTFWRASAAHLPDRPALRHAAGDRGADHPAHDPARAAAARADAGHRRAGAAERAGEEGPAAVPVRPPAVRIQGQAARSPARQGEAGRAGAEGRHADQRAEDRQAQGRSRLREVPAEAVDRSGEAGRRPGGGRAEVDRAGRRRRGRHQGSAGRGGTRATALHVGHRRREHDGRRDPGRARPGALLPRQHADGGAGGRLHHQPAGAPGNGGRRRCGSARSRRSSSMPTAICSPTTSRRT